MDFILRVSLLHNKEASFKEISKRESDTPYPLSFFFKKLEIKNYGEAFVPRRVLIPNVSSFDVKYEYIKYVDHISSIENRIKLDEGTIEIYLRFSNYPFLLKTVPIDDSFENLKDRFVTRSLNDTPQFFYFPVKVFQEYDEDRVIFEPNHLKWVEKNEEFLKEILSYALNRYTTIVCSSHSKLYNFITSHDINIFQGLIVLLRKIRVVPKRSRGLIFALTFPLPFLLFFIEYSFTIFTAILLFIFMSSAATYIIYYFISKKDLKIYLLDVTKIEQSVLKVVGYRYLDSSFYRLRSQTEYEVIFDNKEKRRKMIDPLETIGPYSLLSEKFSQIENKIIYKSQIIFTIVVGLLAVLFTNLDFDKILTNLELFSKVLK